MSQPVIQAPRQIAKYAFIALIAVLQVGCVRRRMTVRTNPPGARVFVDKQPIGVSPAATAFTYYGTREFEVVADGYETVKVTRRIAPPWYQIPPFDFISETLWPGKIRDERIIDITMVPSRPPGSEELTERAEVMRAQSSQGIGVSLIQPGVPRNGGPFSSADSLSNSNPILPPPEFTTPPTPAIDVEPGFPLSLPGVGGYYRPELEQGSGQ